MDMKHRFYFLVFMVVIFSQTLLLGNDQNNFRTYQKNEKSNVENNEFYDSNAPVMGNTFPGQGDDLDVIPFPGQNDNLDKIPFPGQNDNLDIIPFPNP